jgi:hypothetical protein
VQISIFWDVIYIVTPGAKRQGREADYSPPSSAEVSLHGVMLN